ncbi:putative F-box domain-containing protein [Rosa chinensis]|uniref:Putative F-box domain-containing protein n=1 Tax=Rosa chinensis TaxID=74649 RepID=A0A2P6QXZ4_ROSCH|nr:F-box protein At3g07870 [Rosa chinensis]PRQ38979.1 putative F-box domain-containing protein [Rosa chinensis]
MNPGKRAASRSSQGQRGNWKPKGAFNIQELPQALVIDILSRLSIKALYSCRCVCEDWLHIIHDPQFARLHLLRSPISILIKTSSRARDQGKFDLIHISGSPMRVERMRFAPNNVLPVCPVSVVKLMNSCNGLLCVCEWMRYDRVYVCNPILGEYISIPLPDRNRHYSIDFVALGFNTRTNEYKIVQTNYYSNYAHEPEAMIYTIGTGVWRSIGKPPSGYRGGPYHSIPFCMELFIGFPFITVLLHLYNLSTLNAALYFHCVWNICYMWTFSFGSRHLLNLEIFI